MRLEAIVNTIVSMFSRLAYAYLHKQKGPNLGGRLIALER